MNLPIVGARGKPDICHKGNATDRVFVSSKSSYSFLFLPELDRFVRRACISGISQVGTGKTLLILTGDELFSIDGHNSQDRLSVAF
jgi:hypothetical protein